MREPGGGARLLEEALALVGAGGEVRRKQVDGDGAVERHIAGQEHDAHAAAAELALDRIAAGEQLLEGQEFGADRGGHVCRVLRAARRGVSSPGFPDRNRTYFPALTLPLSTRGRPEQAVLFAIGPRREKEGVGRPVVGSTLAEAERPEAVDGDGPPFRGL